MRTFEVTILGCGAALPARNRNPSAQVLNANGSLYLIDCGEGTQIQMRKFGVRIQKIDLIFISHLHGDHYFGLVGLLSTMHLLGRDKILRVYGPKGLKEVVDLQFKMSGTYLKFPLDITELNDENDLIWSDKKVIVKCFPLQHRVQCHGFHFKEQQGQRNIKKEKIKELVLSIPDILKLKAGKDVISRSGNEVRVSDVTIEPQDARSYAYCSDTIYDPELGDILKDCSMIYHEATFADDLVKRAKETYHSTARQAAMIAKKANAKSLLLGHFSSRYKDLDKLLEQAKEEFIAVQLAKEGEVFKISE